MGKTNTKINTKINANTTTKIPTNKITLPRGTYTIDGDGNLIIHGGGKISGGEAGGMPSPARLGLSYEEFMEKPDGRSAERRIGERSTESHTGGGGDPFGMDFSALGTDPEKMIRECRGTVYAYARCSTLHQDYQRQIDAFLKLGIREENIFKEKRSGKDFNREEFQKMMNALTPGDCIVVLELDRFGRNMSEIKKHWFWITQQKRADIIVLDQPILNTRLGAHGLAGFLADLVLAVFSLMAEIERKLINKRMEAGIRLARLAGKKLGRKLMEIPEIFWKMKDMFLKGRISQNKASQRLGVDPKTFRSWVERTGDVLDAREWEELKVWIEEQEREERIRQAKMDYGETSGAAAVEMSQKVTTGSKKETEQEEAMEAAMVQKSNAKCSRAAIGQENPTESDQTESDDGHGCVRQTVEKSYGAEKVDYGAAGNPAQADGKAVKKGRRDHRKSKRQKLFGGAKKKTAPGRKPRPKSRRI